MAVIQLRSERTELWSFIKTVNIKDTKSLALPAFWISTRPWGKLTTNMYQRHLKITKRFCSMAKTYCEWDSNSSSLLKVANAHWLALLCDVQMMFSQHHREQRGAAEPSCSGEGLGRMVPSDYEVRQGMVRPQLCKCRQRDPQAEICQLQPPSSLLLLTGHLQKLSQEYTNISRGNLENLNTWLQPGRDSPGYMV